MSSQLPRRTKLLHGSGWATAALPAVMVIAAALIMVRYPISKSSYELPRKKLAGKS